MPIAMSLPRYSARTTLLLVLVACLAPAASATATAVAQPPRPEPGAAVLLVFTIETAALAEASLREEVTCTVDTPTGETLDCASLGALLDLRVQGGARSYSFALTAPELPGVYVARFARTAALGLALPPDAAPAQAETTFEVAAAELLDDSASAPAPDVPGAGSVDAAPSPAGTRWLFSLFMASGATAAAVTLARRSGGP